jgi:hypothetical protein
MSRHPLLRGVSACALSFALVTPAFATHTLPTIDVNGQQRRTVARAGSLAGRFALGRDAPRRQACLRPALAASEYGGERDASADPA